MTADPLGGVWTYALELAAALAAGSGAETALATLGGEPNERQRARAEAVPGLRLLVSDFRVEWMDEPWDDVRRSGRWLRALERSLRPDVVHLNGYAHGSLDFRAPVLVVGHSCVLSWWEAVRGEAAPPRYGRYRDAVAAGLRGADRVVTPTAAMLDALRRHYGPLPSARVVANGRSGRGFRPAPKGRRIVACGRLWDDGKNLAALERAAPDLPWPVEVVGSLRHPHGGKRTAEGLRCAGPLPEDGVARRMRRAAVCAHPARYEPFGLVPVEAALCGCALVLGDIPTLREVWGDGALFVDPDDPPALEGALRRLIDDRFLRAELAGRACRRARRLTPSRMADRYLALYRELLEERSAPRIPAGAGRARTP